MSSRSIRFAMILIAITLFATGCTLIQPQNSPANPAPANPTAQPTATKAATPTPASAATKASGANIIQLTVVSGKNEARYRVREQLAELPLPSDAIGRTQSITGTIVGKTDGTIVSADSKFVVDLRTLQSDRSQRDNFLRQAVLETSRYPNATFVPKEVQGLLLTLPPTGTLVFKLIGDLTIRNVTKSVTWDVTCNPGNDQGTCTATTSFKFGYFDMTPPRVPVVLSVQDNITLEVDLTLARVSS